MEQPRCWRCGTAQPFSAGSMAGACVYCGADLRRRPVIDRIRWTAHRPAGVPDTAPRPRIAAPRYLGPPRHPYRPIWGFAPSIWVPESTSGPPAPRMPSLRSTTIFAWATAVMCVLAAAAEAGRYLLLVRGRTEVLPSSQVRFSDAAVTATSVAALLLGIVAAISAIPTLGRVADYAAHRSRLLTPRTPGQRLTRLLVPGWNLYGAGVVVAEIDAAVRTVARAGPHSVGAPQPFRWTDAEVSRLSANVESGGGGEQTAVGTVAPVPRSPSSLAHWWWAAWAVNGVVAALVLTLSWVPVTLQLQANLVALHLVLDVLGAVVAVLTALVLRSWQRALVPRVETWPTDWVLVPPRVAGQSDVTPRVAGQSGLTPQAAGQSGESVAAAAGASAEAMPESSRSGLAERDSFSSTQR